MKYYLIAGEASGDLHAAHLMAELKRRDNDAQFRCIGGDMMQAEGGELLSHYRDLAYMGIWPVLTHLGTILRAMGCCRADVARWQPDVLILVDYPGFNLDMAKWVKRHTKIPVFYYISPKIWAWKEYRIGAIRRNVDALFSILPFEPEWFRSRHGYHVDYVGNPTMDEVSEYRAAHPADPQRFRAENGLDGRPIIALLAGSRRQEIRDNLSRMAQATAGLERDYQMVVAGAPGIDAAYYKECAGGQPLHVVYGRTYPLLQHAAAALVTSGTATLETALFRVPQVVCYYMRIGSLANWLHPMLIKAPYISLVNLVTGEEVVRELIGAEMNPKRVRVELDRILPGAEGRETMLQGYERMAEKLGEPGAPAHCAEAIIARLKAL